MSKVEPAFEVVMIDGTPRIALRDGLDWNEVLERIASLETRMTIIEGECQVNSFTFASLATK
ncbi:MAG: hypothetical protein WBB98_04600 [Xanthobacteraceae bacterium]